MPAVSAATSPALHRFSGPKEGGAPHVGRPTAGATAAATTAASTATETTISRVPATELSGGAMVRALSAAVARCSRARPASDDALIADQLASFVFTNTARDFADAVRRGEEPLPDEPSSTSLQHGRAQQQRPVHVHMLSLDGRTSWGGMALSRDDIGPETTCDSVDELLEHGDDGPVRAGAMSTFGDDFASVMTTPDRKAAESWANPTPLRFSFAGDEVRKLARDGLLYASVEFSSLDLALLYDRDPRSARGHGSLQRLQVVSPSSSPSSSPPASPA